MWKMTYNNRQNSKKKTILKQQQIQQQISGFNGMSFIFQ